MGLIPVSLKVKKEVYELAMEMVRLGIARNRNHAFNIILEKGYREARRLVFEEKKIGEIIGFIEEKGGLELETRNVSEALKRLREREWSI